MDSLTLQPTQDARKLEDPRDVSGLKFFSMALVVKTPKEFPSWIVEVTPIESLAIQDSGDIKKEDVPYNQSHPDRDGAYSSQKEVTMNNIIEAEWLPLSDSNRPTPPCVYRDETVVLYKFMDVQKYYWSTVKHEPKLRRKEMVRWAASNETEPLVAYEKPTSHFIELNALDRFLEVGTPVKGESVAYRIKLDVAKAQLDIADDRGNNIVLNSDQGSIDITSVNRITLNTKYIEMNADETVVNSPLIHLNGETRIYRDLKVKQNTVINKRLDVQVAYARTWFGSLSKGGPRLTNLDISQRNRDTFEFDSEGSSPGSLVPVDANNPPPKTSKAYEMDRQETVNKSPGELTGDKVMDAPKIASGKVPVVSKPDIPQLKSIQETAAKVNNAAEQLSSSLTETSSASMSGLKGLARNAAQSSSQLQQDTQSTTGQSSRAVQQTQATVMDPINSVTRSAQSLVNGVTSSIHQTTQEARSAVMGPVNSAVQAAQSVGRAATQLTAQAGSFLQPVNTLTRSITGNTSATMGQLQTLQNKAYQITGSINSLATTPAHVINKLTAPVQSLSNTASAGINKVSYAAMNITEPIRQVTNTVNAVQRAAQTTQNQLNSLARTSTQSLNAVRSSPTLQRLL